MRTASQTEEVGGVGEAISKLAYPVIAFNRGHLVVIGDETSLRRCTRAGVRRGWFDDLDIVDASRRRWPVRLRDTRADGVIGWLTGQLIADLELGRPKTVTMEDVKGRTVAVLEKDAELWDADGQLEERLEVVRRASDMRKLVNALETDVP